GEMTLAGKRQHFIPQRLLRLFADERRRVRVVRQDGRTFIASTKNVALENELFGPPGAGSPDEVITSDEQRVGLLLDASSEAPGGPVDSVIAAKVIVHYSWRIRPFRRFMEDAGVAVVDRFDCRMADDSLKRLLGDHLRDDPSSIVELLDEGL